MLKVPAHQVAGHRADGGKLGPLVDDSGRFYKPLQGDERGAREVAFYTSFSSDSKVPDHISRFFPKFYGTQLVEASDGSGMKPHLVLQDLTFSRVHPSVMDIKIGSRTWGPEESAEQIQKCLKKDTESSSLPLGFRLSGMQIFGTKESGFWKPEKKWMQSISTDEVRLLLKKFVSSDTSASRPDCAFASVVYGGSKGILSQLLELKAWFEDQTSYHFFACSILMMFEKELALDRKSPCPEIKLVDFAHVFEGRGVIDHNFLGGLCSLIKFISEILTTPEDSSTNGLLEDVHRSHVYPENGSA
ncbi:inositol polyphosphate multikinase alpha [Sesamum indicum]|uniref:Inositol polyphosphate multikinase n=1 Tax=Sesamum indicum TaxID=4182 RepID=A0A6I9SSL7_SESIN|nr:inositol polyphosphate multikinase alpha [Sesamum indicum]XP_011073265.1 inositol polyphosphate multikinase alpha [Sesamum indicum]XP_011073266.1 inositol polyphosphate multikinase alpha [Sesamum indicum]XP_020548298.1 inositol polyphosphate multikinase alpha [Sesamum indicum]